MRIPGLRWLLAVLVAAPLAMGAVAPAAAARHGPAWVEAAPDSPQQRNDGRTLRAGDTTLAIDVVDVADRARSEAFQQWAAEAAGATLTAYGRFPLKQATVRITQIDSDDRSPVPWGQTLRNDSVAVLLYVRRDATPAQLRADWTAVHELSHLFHPFLGSEGRWLSEGLASYYQNVLRARAGLLEADEAWRELDAGFGRGRRESSGMTLEELSQRHRGTMRVYWAGAAFWLEADLALRGRGSSLDEVLSQYSRCCLRGTGLTEPEAFLGKLDELSGTQVFVTRYREYAASRSFPDLSAAYAALGLRGGEDALGFSSQSGATKLRWAIMGTRRTAKAR